MVPESVEPPGPFVTRALQFVPTATIRATEGVASAFLRASGLKGSTPLVDVTREAAEGTMRRFAACYAPGTAFHWKSIRLGATPVICSPLTAGRRVAPTTAAEAGPSPSGLSGTTRNV